MRMLQVCNVGRIVGGTAACAWSVTRALPDCEHHVTFLSAVNDETARMYRPAVLHQNACVTAAAVRALRPDVVVLHNTPDSRVESGIPSWTLQYVHSRGKRADADRVVYCSRWLAAKGSGGSSAATNLSAKVLYQAVPRPLWTGGAARMPDSERMTVGRLCTPIAAKWPPELGDFYNDLAGRHPLIDWEFVGCPEDQRRKLAEACRGRARFLPAGWTARSHLWRWHVFLYHHPWMTESFGRVVAESLRAGCVPVVDARGGFCEQFDTQQGFLCGTRDDFHAALSALQNPAVRLQMSQAAQTHGDRAFSLCRFRSDLLRLFRE